MNTSPGQTRMYIGLAWIAAVLLYTAYATYTYTGLFARACDWQDHVFGAHETSAAFMIVLILCSLPAFLLSPELWHTGKRPITGAAAAAPLDPAKQQRTLALLGGGSLLIGVAAGLLAFTASHRTPVVVNMDLLRGEESRDISRADQLVVNGMEQIDISSVLTTTTNGSESSERYIPFTGQAWNEQQPIQYVLREGALPHTLEEREAGRSVRFGPAAIFRHALPGEVRRSWQKRGLTLSPSVIVLDQNLSHGNEVPWIVCFFGLMFGAVFLGMGVYLPRRMNLRRSA